MTDSEKLDLLLDKMNNLESEINGLRRQQMKSTAELKGMDALILDEIERVHTILNRHTTDKTVHTA